MLGRLWAALPNLRPVGPQRSKSLAEVGDLFHFRWPSAGTRVSRGSLLPRFVLRSSDDGHVGPGPSLLALMAQSLAKSA